MTEKKIRDCELVENMIVERIADSDWIAFIDTVCAYCHAEMFEEEITSDLYNSVWTWADKLDVTLVALVNWYWYQD